MALTHTRADIPGRLLAIIVFLIGIGILFFVFTLALHLFREPIPGLGLSIPATKTPPAAVNIGSALMLFFRELLLLALMTIAGSQIAGKGIHLYFGTHGPHHAAQAIQPEPHQENAKIA